MPTISTFYGTLIQIFWQEHPPPHFHALYAEHEARIDIRTLEVIEVACPAWRLLSCSNGHRSIALN